MNQQYYKTHIIIRNARKRSCRPLPLLNPPLPYRMRTTHQNPFAHQTSTTRCVFDFTRIIPCILSAVLWYPMLGGGNCFFFFTVGGRGRGRGQGLFVVAVCPPPHFCGCRLCFVSQGTLSLNAAMFAAVLLASRLESNEKVFAIILFALELFAFFPLARCVPASAQVLLCSALLCFAFVFFCRP